MSWTRYSFFPDCIIWIQHLYVFRSKDVLNLLYVSLNFQEENVSDDESEVEYLHNDQSSEVEQNSLDIMGIPDTTLNLQPSLSNDEKNEDSEGSNEEEISVNSGNSLIEEDLQNLQPGLSNVHC